MKFIEVFANWCARQLAKTDENDDDLDYYDYSIQGLCYFTLYTVISFFISLPLGYAQYLPIIIFGLLYIREMGGGYHQSKMIYCMINSCLFYLIIGMTALLLKEYYLAFFLFSFCVFTKLDEVPKYSAQAVEEGIVHSEEKQDFFRLMYIVRLFVIFILSLFCIVLHLEGIKPVILNLTYDLRTVSMILSMSILINKFSLTDFAFNMMKKLP